MFEKLKRKEKYYDNISENYLKYQFQFFTDYCAE